MSKKGQAAMEFLMTYGWAILAAIIAIGVLAYFGVFSPGRFVSDNYVVNAPFNIRAGQVNSVDQEIHLEILNGAGESVTVDSIEVTNCATITPASAHPTGSFVTYDVGPCLPAVAAGETFRGDIKITYKKAGGSLIPLQSTGTITARVV